MDIDEMKDRKLALQRAIERELASFTTATGVKVSALRMGKIDITRMGLPTRDYIYEVAVEVTI